MKKTLADEVVITMKTCVFNIDWVHGCINIMNRMRAKICGALWKMLVNDAVNILQKILQKYYGQMGY